MASCASKPPYNRNLDIFNRARLVDMVPCVKPGIDLRLITSLEQVRAAFVPSARLNPMWRTEGTPHAKMLELDQRRHREIIAGRTADELAEGVTMSSARNFINDHITGIHMGLDFLTMYGVPQFDIQLATYLGYDLDDVIGFTIDKICSPSKDLMADITKSPTETVTLKGYRRILFKILLAIQVYGPTKKPGDLATQIDHLRRRAPLFNGVVYNPLRDTTDTDFTNPNGLAVYRSAHPLVFGEAVEAWRKSLH
jgi:hypothetical protein